MPKQPNQMKKIPLLIKMLHEQTDDEHGLSMPEILEQLSAAGVKAERKSIYRDFNIMRECGYDVIKRPGRPTRYAIGQRDFEYPELLLLVDAVQSSRFLTERKSNQLVNRIKGLTSKHLGEQLQRHVHVERRIKTQNESVYYSIDAIQNAIQQGFKVSFRYFKHDIRQKRVYRKEGASYLETPVHLVYADGYYYLIAYNDHHEDFVTYRVDRMSHIQVTEVPATKCAAISEFRVAEYALQAFGMFGGEKVTATIEFEASAIDEIRDRFGSDGFVVVPQSDELGKATFTIRKSSVFFGWLTGFGTRARLVAPSSLVEEYRGFLADIAAQYE